MLRLSQLFVCFVLISILNSEVKSQNLVMNPSFETYSACPVGPSELSKAANWVDPYISIVGDTCSTSDLYNACNTLGAMGVDVPANILGTEPARTGNGYAGIIVYEGIALLPNDCNSSGGSGWREYLEGELTSPLTAGQQYCVSFWVSLADNVKWASNNFAVHFSNSLIAINCSTVGSNSDLSSYGVNPQLTYAGSPILTTSGWTKLEWTYTAVGGEKFITIGNFNGNAGTNYVCSNASVMNPYAYYYVEDVSVVPNACTTVNLTVCEESNGDLTVSGGTGPYTWAQWLPASSTPITNQTECQACGYSWTFGTCLNGMTPATTCNTPAGYSNFGTGTTVTVPGGATQIKVTDSGGNFYEITDLSTVPPCSASCDATITPAGPFCANAAAVNLTAAETGGTWSGTGITNASAGTFNPATAGAGSHVITYTLGCGDSDTETIIVNALDNAGFSYASGSYCLADPNPTPTISGLAGGTFTINNSGTINASTGQINITASGVGNYIVTYTTNGTCPNQSTFNVSIISAADATITPVGPFCANASSVNLTAATPGGTWSGTGITNASTGTFDPATAGAGSHTITYIVTGTCGDSDTETIVVNAVDNAGFSYSSGSYCLTDANPTPTVTGVAGGTFTINNGGTINASSGQINITATGVGSYTVTYTTNGSCPNQSTFNVSIASSTDATISAAGPFCMNANSVNLTAVSPGGTWTGNGITNASAGTFNPTTAGVGSHVITYTISGSCGSVDTATIVVNAADNVSISYSSNSFCLTDPNPTPTIMGTTGGTFTINNSGVINAATGVINIASTGAGAFTITYMTNSSCPDTATFNININSCSAPLPVANFSASSTNICVGDCINFTDLSTSSVSNGVTVWAWSFTGAIPTTSGTQNPINVCYNTAGTYAVALTVTDSNGTDTETKTAYITVTSCTNPTAIFSISDSVICKGTCVTFTNSSTNATSWQWTFQDGIPSSSSNQNPGSVCFDSTGTKNIKLVVSNSFGSDSVTHQINVVQPQLVVVNNDTTIQLGESVNLSATGVTNGVYIWSPSTELSCSVCPNPVSTPEETITYTVITSDTNGCTSTDNITIIVEFENVIWVPNIFSPNGDGANDILYVRGKGVQKFKFFLYDRWGEKVFETSDLKQGWDGTFRGKDMNKAVFVYYLEATFIDGKEVVQKGDITLVK